MDGSVTVNGVSFSIEHNAKKSREEFISEFKETFFTDKNNEEAETILSDAYDLINPAADKAEPETPPKKTKKAD